MRDWIEEEREKEFETSLSSFGNVGITNQTKKTPPSVVGL